MNLGILFLQGLQRRVPGSISHPTTAWLRASVVNPKEAKHAIREANCENMSSTAPLTDVEEVQQAV